MRTNRGKVTILLFLMIAHVALAEDFLFQAHVDNSSPYLKEPLLLDINIKQTNPDLVLFFDFTLPKSDSYLSELIDARHNDTLHHTEHHYRYQIYPLKTGEITLSFDLLKRITDEQKVAFSASGDRDDFKKLETVDHHVALSPLRLHVKALPKSVDLVGTYTLKSTLNKTKLSAHEPLSYTLVVSGKGFPPTLQDPFGTLKGITRFTEAPKLEKKIKPDGIYYTLTLLYAFSADHSFVLPAVSLEAFNPKTEKLYQLSTPSYPITVDAPDTSSLLDEHNNPVPLQKQWEWLGDTLKYLFVFMLGVLSTILYGQFKKRKTNHAVSSSEEDLLYEKVKSAPDIKTLLQVLIATQDPRLNTEIDRIENAYYHTHPLSLRTLKKHIMEKIK